MSARGEGAGQPSTSAQGQPAAPAPQKRGRGRPRKQQQVSTPAGWEPQPTFAPSARAPRRAATRTREFSRRGRHALPAGRGRAAVSRARLSRGRPRPSGRGGGEPGRAAGGGVGGSASSDFRYCAPPGVSRGLLATGSGRGPTFQGSRTLSSPLYSCPGGRKCGGLGCSGGAELEGLESRGPFVGSFSRHPGLLAGPGLRRRSRRFGAFPKCLVAGDSRPPDKERVGRPVLSLLFKCGGAAEVSRGRGYRRVWVRKGRD